MNKRRNLALISAMISSVAALVLLFTLWHAANTNPSTDSALASQFMPHDIDEIVQATRLYPQDLPYNYRNNWLINDVATGEGSGREFIFYGNQLAPMAHVAQQIIVYQPGELTQRALQTELENHKGISFESLKDGSTDKEHFFADTIFYGCAPPVVMTITENNEVAIGLTIPGNNDVIHSRYCITIATYGRIYVELAANIIFDDTLLGLEQYQEVVRISDHRISQFIAQEKWAVIPDDD